ncbi:sialomucin core protein 24-like isoform X2 [Ostrea edulis]|uniref:sialomucin core protein 24-like isoform X2 n=1 Tax=Ostrea edulis TaxID=37623 RepID=UPI0024AEF38B|nr:sialomucin core protein 24-like isoform X2 [Ostrea edulis]
MNKKLVDFGVAVVFLVVICVTSCWGGDPVTTELPSTMTNERITTENPVASVDCTVYTNQTACCEDTACAWINCTVVHEGCHNLNNDTDKQQAATACKINVTDIDKNNICESPLNTTTATVPTTTPTTTTTNATTTTPVASVDCTVYTNQTACCEDTACAWINCTVGTEIHESCHNLNNSTDKKHAAEDCKIAITEIGKKDICKNPVTSTTIKPSSSSQQTTTTAKGTTVPPHGQHFDGASFVGGMILMGGLIAIAYFALKFYRVRKDRSYRTL